MNRLKKIFVASLCIVGSTFAISNNVMSMNTDEKVEVIEKSKEESNDICIEQIRTSEKLYWEKRGKDLELSDEYVDTYIEQILLGHSSKEARAYSIWMVKTNNDKQSRKFAKIYSNSIFDILEDDKLEAYSRWMLTHFDPRQGLIYANAFVERMALSEGEVRSDLYASRIAKGYNSKYAQIYTDVYTSSRSLGYNELKSKFCADWVANGNDPGKKEEYADTILEKMKEGEDILSSKDYARIVMGYKIQV